MTADRFASALKSRVVLISGGEEVLRREALRGVLQASQVQPDDFDLETFAGDTSDPATWIASVGTAPFLADRRVAVVRHLLRCDFDRLKGSDLSKLPDSALLILVADEEGGSEDRERRNQSQRASWKKAVESAKGSVFACDLESSAVRATIKKRAEERGKELSARAVDLLAEMTGVSLSRALDELEKLEIYVGEQPQIREADVRRVVSPSREWSVYKMVDGIFSGEVAGALRQLRILVGSAAKAEEVAFSRILPQVSRQLRQLWQARLCIEARCGPGNAPPEIRALFPGRPNLATDLPFRQNSVMAAARNVTFPRLTRCFRILADTDARLKGALSGFSGIETLERMILDMAAA